MLQIIEKQDNGDVFISLKSKTFSGKILLFINLWITVEIFDIDFEYYLAVNWILFSGL